MRLSHTCLVAALLASAANAQSVQPRPPAPATPGAPSAGAGASSLSPVVQARPVAPCDLPPQPEAPPTPWPNGVVYFEFDANVSAAEKADMYAAMDRWNYSNAAVAFVPRTVGVNSNYLHIQDSAGNSSYVGMIGGSQAVNIYNWNIEFTMAHELCHALGFWHEQSRPDRDTYVQIVPGNICCSAANNFDIVQAGDWLHVGTGYDFDSVMHYDECAFTTCIFCIGGCETILVLPPNQGWQGSIGQRDHLSALDIVDMKIAYGQVNIGPRYVVPNYGGAPNGSLVDPYWNVVEVNAYAPAGATVYFQSGTYDEGIITISKLTTIVPFGGVVTLR